MKIGSTEIWFMSPYTLPLLDSIWASINKEPIDLESERKSCFFLSILLRIMKIRFFERKIRFSKFFQIVEWLFQDLSGTLPDLEHAQEPSSTLLGWFEPIFKKWKFSIFFWIFLLENCLTGTFSSNFCAMQARKFHFFKK